MFRSFRSLMLAAVVGSAGLLGSASTASAGDHCAPTYRTVITYKTVHDTVCVKVPYLKEVIRYDHCGRPYCVTETCYRTVEKVVCRTVPCVSYVKVCDY